MSAVQGAPSRGVLLMAHGARDPAWARPFEAIASRLRTRDPSLHVELGFLELMKPGIADAGLVLANAGCMRVDLVPLFLGAGGHVRKDLPLIHQELQVARPGVAWHLRPAIGEVDEVVLAMADATFDLLHAP